MRKAVKKTLILFNWIVAICLLLAYLCIYISPENFWLPALFGLAYPAFLILNIMTAIFWMVRKKKYFLISLLTIILGWGHFRNFMQIPIFNRSSPVEHINDTLSDAVGRSDPIMILSYNVRLFDYYKWSENPDASQMIYELIREKKPGILCLQEIFTPVKGEIPTLYSDHELSPYNYKQIAYALRSSLNSKYGIATLSVFPIINQGEIRFTESHNLVIFSDLKINNDTIRVYNNHLQSIRLRKKEYDLMKIINSGEEEAMNEIKDISYRLKHAFQKRAHQADKLAEHIQSSPYPVIVCGDFNDTPVSYSYRKIRKDLVDAHIKSGKGIGSTYSGVFPSYRIDYILHSQEIESMGFEITKVNYSDHYPVSCLFEF